MFRPFPYKEVMEALQNAKSIAVLDRAASFGANAPLYGEVKNALYDLKKRPALFSCLFGLGGRSIYESDIEGIFTNIDEQQEKEEIQKLVRGELVDDGNGGQVWQ